MSGVMSNMPSNPTKEPIHLKTCTLIPPNPQAPLPTTRERPLGCKTVFVGGLAENITGKSSHLNNIIITFNFIYVHS